MTAGGCQCGAVRYTLAGGPYALYACHCRECQKQAASAFGMSMPVPIEALSLAGTLAIWERPSASGRTTRCHFCLACGTRIYHRSSASRAFVTLKAGTLDDTSGLRLQAHLWTSASSPGLRLTRRSLHSTLSPRTFAAGGRS